MLKQQGVSFGEGCYASFNGATSTMVVRNTPDMHSLVQQIVDNALLTEPAQVVVRVTVMRTQEQHLKELGFDWLISPFDFGNLFLGGGTVGSGTEINDVPGPPTSNVNTDPVTAGLRSGDEAVLRNSIDALIANPTRDPGVGQRRAPGVLTFNGLLSKGDVQMMIRAIDQEKGFDVISTPATVTRSGQRSSIKVVREFIYPTEYEPPELPTSVDSFASAGFGFGSGSTGFPVTPATPTAFETRETGMVLEVEPVVDANRQFIDVTLNPVLTEFDGFVNYGSPILAPQSTGPLGRGGQDSVEITANRILMPVFSVNRANTAVTIADGATIVIGGLLEEKISQVEDKVPLLGDIPMVGRLFTTKASQPVRRVVLFLVNVELLDPAGEKFGGR